MPRLSHGRIVTPGSARAELSTDLHRFDFLFPGLQDDPDDLLPESAATVKALQRLAATMVDPAPADQADPGGDSPIPAAYTYLGQFVDHDITLEPNSGPVVGDDLVPMTVAEIHSTLSNTRTATLDLDSLYDPPAPRVGDRMRLGTVFGLQQPAPPEMRPPGKGDDNDLPREPRNADPDRDRAALIGDPRNDENTVISQLHVAFLTAHNRLVDEGHGFDEARRILRQHYQHMVVEDYLRKIADPVIVDDVLENGNRWFNALADPFFMPLEFSGAAFRFGHTMVRGGYDFNVNFNVSAGGIPATLGFLFTFSALSGQLGFGSRPADGFDRLPDNWIIEWENIAGENVPAAGHARRFDTRLAGPGNTALFDLRTVQGASESGLAAILSARNLLRGYRLRLPTGQAVARTLGLHVLTPAELTAAVGPEQGAELTASGMADRTPLWFYLLAESRAQSHGGAHLGPLGSTIVAEVLVGLVRRSTDSVLRIPGWRPCLPTLRPGVFELADLLRYARVLAGGAPSVLHVVNPGETLSTIARDRLGAAGRWPEIFAGNRAVLARPDRIFPGQVLHLPTGPAPTPQLRFHVVAPGDTLSAIARDQLGDADRWREIFRVNGAVITNPDVIVVGQVLLLPAK